MYCWTTIIMPCSSWMAILIIVVRCSLYARTYSRIIWEADQAVRKVMSHSRGFKYGKPLAAAKK